MSGVTENKFLMNVANRLGLSEEVSVIKKSDELLRMLNVKTTVKNLGDFAKVAICLDLATSSLGVGFDKEFSITLSGLKKATYQKHLNMIAKLLEIDKLLTIQEVCVQMSCTMVNDLAQQILSAYAKQNQLVDISHPQYIAISVYTACKLRSIKVARSHFIALSHLKQMQWKELENEFMKFADGIGLKLNAPKKKTAKNELHEFLENHVTANKIDANPDIHSCKNESLSIAIEDYIVWKQRIIAAAKKALN